MFLCAFLWLISNAFGQAQDGNLAGSILDLTGAAVPNAKVEAESIATGVKTATTTDVSGKWDIGAFNIIQTQPTPAQDLPFKVQATDGDADFAQASFNVHINPVLA